MFVVSYSFQFESNFVFQKGFFNAIQYIQNKKKTKNIEQLITVVKEAFYREQSRKNLNKVFLSLQQAMTSVLECKGDNNYRLKHMSKDKLINNNTLPISLHCDQELINIANEILAAPEEHFPNLNKRQKTSATVPIQAKSEDNMMICADL